MKIKLRLMCVAIITTLTACVGHQVQSTAPVDEATVELAEAAVAINSSLKTLAVMSEEKGGLTINKTELNPANYGMGRIATIDWTGPMEPLVRRLAELTHYRVNVFGHQPAIPVIVAVNKRDRMIGDLLREASVQAKEQVKLVVFPSTKIIEMHYITN